MVNNFALVYCSNQLCYRVLESRIVEGAETATQKQESELEVANGFLRKITLKDLLESWNTRSHKQALLFVH